MIAKEIRTRFLTQVVIRFCSPLSRLFMFEQDMVAVLGMNQQRHGSGDWKVDEMWVWDRFSLVFLKLLFQQEACCHE